MHYLQHYNLPITTSAASQTNTSTDAIQQQSNQCEQPESNKNEPCMHCSCDACMIAPRKIDSNTRPRQPEDASPECAKQASDAHDVLHPFQSTSVNSINYVGQSRPKGQKTDSVHDKGSQRFLGGNESYFMKVTLPRSNPLMNKAGVHCTPPQRSCSTLMREVSCRVQPTHTCDSRTDASLDDRREERDVVFHPCHASQGVGTAAIIDTYSEYGLTSCSEPTTAVQQFNGDTSHYCFDEEEDCDDVADNSNSFSCDYQRSHPSLDYPHGSTSSMQRHVVHQCGYSSEARAWGDLPLHKLVNAVPATTNRFEASICTSHTAPVQGQSEMNKYGSTVASESLHTATTTSSSASTGATTIAALTHTHVANGNSDGCSRVLMSTYVRANCLRVTDASLISAPNEDVISEDFLVQPVRAEANFLTDIDRKVRARCRLEPLLCPVKNDDNTSLALLTCRRVSLPQCDFVEQGADNSSTLKLRDMPNCVAQRRLRNSIAMQTVRELLTASI